MSNHEEYENLPAPERRSFLGILSGLITAGIGVVMAVTIGRFTVSPLLAKSAEAEWMDLGLISDLEEGKLIKKTVTVAQDAGWGKFEAQRAVWVVRKGEGVMVFSGVCPHLGCSVNNQEDKFVCACHGSYWDSDGRTTAGPTPRGLDSLEHRVEEEKLQIRYQYFKQGVSNKEVLS
ncbi:MAG: ubiquinol-cytochrome c reductase iron-sulfur subunit [Blastocatellia bacterium]